MAKLKGSRSRYCWSHTPENAAAHRASATLGGVRRQQGASAPVETERDIPAADLKTIDGGVAALEAVYESLRCNPSARALARARALVSVVGEALSALKDHELERRIAALEGGPDGSL